ncbi:5527_t:CDS:2, partial [Dentiscutata heterogama]
MSDDPIPSTSIIQENFTNNSEYTLTDSSLISENIEISEPNFASVFEYTEQNQSFDSLNFDDYAKGSNQRKKKKFSDNIDLTQFGLANDMIIESDIDSEHETQFDLLDN